MSTVTSNNFTSSNAFQWADSDTDQFDREHISKPAEQLDTHDHSSGHGAAVARLAANAVVTASILDDSITAAKLKDSAATDADRAVTSDHIRDGAVTAAKLAAAAATGAKLGTDVVTLVGTQTLTNKSLTSPILTGSVDVQGILLEAKGVTVASATTITLGATGNFFTISGTIPITTITAKAAGTRVVLQFSSPGCKVAGGGNIALRGMFASGGTSSILELISDGTNWNEMSRACPPHIVRYYMAAQQSVTSGVTGEILGKSADGTTFVLDPEYNNYIGVTYDGTTGMFVLPAGWWRVTANILWTTGNVGDSLETRLEKGGVTYRQLASVIDDDVGVSATETIYSNGSAEFAFRVQQASGSSCTIAGGAASASGVAWEYLGA